MVRRKLPLRAMGTIKIRDFLQCDNPKLYLIQFGYPTMFSSSPIAAPSHNGSVSATTVRTGRLIPELRQLILFSDEEWEEFVLEWATSLKSEYDLVERCGRSRDSGRDVIATPSASNPAVWDNYQCKKYDSPLQPNQIWVELAKVIWHSIEGHYSFPRSYYFAAPHGTGNALTDLLKRPSQLKADLFSHWDTHCRTKISKVFSVPMSSALRSYIDGLDFSAFKAVQPQTLLEGHAKTRWHAARFGGGLPERPAPDQPPLSPSASESQYLRKLFEAYAEHLCRTINCIGDLSEQALRDHLDDARIEFYSAESLESFSRDTLPPNVYEGLRNQLHHGIKDDIRSEHADGFARVLAVVRTARILDLSSHPLHERMTIQDRGGICHQLANKGEVTKWTNT